MAVPVVGAIVSNVVRQGATRAAGALASQGVKRALSPALTEGIGYAIRRLLNGKNQIVPPKIEMPPPVNNLAYQTGGLLARLDKQNEILARLYEGIELANLLKLADIPELTEMLDKVATEEVVKPRDKEENEDNLSKETTINNEALDKQGKEGENSLKPFIESFNKHLEKNNQIIEEQSKTIKEIKETKLKEIEELKGIGQKKIDFDPISKSINELKNIGLNAKVENNLKVANEVNIKKLEVANEVIIKKLNAELDITKPVAINLPEKTMIYQDKMLEQKTKEVAIIDERAKFDKTPLTIKDLDGQATTRSEERRVGKECRSRWSPYH